MAEPKFDEEFEIKVYSKDDWFGNASIELKITNYDFLFERGRPIGFFYDQTIDGICKGSGYVDLRKYTWYHLKSLKDRT